MAPKKSEKPKDLAATLSALRTEGAKVGSLSEFPESAPTGLSTGNLTLDTLTGIGGFPTGRITELFGPFSSGKAQRWTDVVHTPDRGFVQIKDLRVGDRISSPFNEPSKVMGVFPQGERDLYRITFSDGTSAVCSDEHLWAVEALTHDLGYVSTVVPASKIVGAVQHKRYRPRDIRLPEVQPVEADAVDLPLDPYLLGALLGDGGLTQGSVMLTTMDAEIVSGVRAVLPAEVNLVEAASAGQARTYRLSTGNTGQKVKNPVLEALRGLSLWGHSSLEKFIPQEYLAGSVAQRLALVQGLMDTDGHQPASAPVKVFYTSSARLAQDFATLVRSLGSPAFLREKSPGTNSVNKSYRVEFRTALPVFTVTRKIRGSVPVRARGRNFVSAEYFGRADCVCIKVSAPSELYLTNDFILTHNTTAALQCAAKVQQAGGNVVFLDYERALDPIYCKALGLDTEDPSFIYVLPEHFEAGINVFRRLAETGEVALGVVDSVAAMTTENELNAETGKVLVGDRAKMMYQACLTPDHKVLRDDLRWVPLGSVEPGDALLGFDEFKVGGHRHYKRAEVLSVQRRVSDDVYRVTLASGKQFRVTGDHRWLVAARVGAGFTYSWRMTADLKVGRDHSPKVLDTWGENTTKDAGWLAGMLDGEGHLNQRAEHRLPAGMFIGLGQVLGPTADRIEQLLKEFCVEAPLVTDREGTTPRGERCQDFRRFGVAGPLREKLKFLGEIRPERLIAKVDFDRLGRLQSWKRDPEAVVSVEKIEPQEIVVMETSTGTFIADGYPMHNCRQLLPLLSNTSTGMVFLNHLLEKIDTSFIGQQMAARGQKQYYTPGGRALGFYASLRIEFKQIGTVKSTVHDDLTDTEDQQIRSTKIKATVVKNKVADPFRTAELRVRFGHGFSQPYSVFSVLEAHGAIKKKGSWFSFGPDLRTDDDQAQIQGEDEVLSQIESDPEWLALLERRAFEILESHDVFMGEPVAEEGSVDVLD